MKPNIAVIILAAGLGTRMKSNKAKVLHEIQGRPMVSYVVETARQVAGNNVIVVIGNQAEKVRQVVTENGNSLFAYQKKPGDGAWGAGDNIALLYAIDITVKFDDNSTVIQTSVNPRANRVRVAPLML